MHCRRLASLFALCSVLAACGDSTSPTSRLGVNVSVDGEPRVTMIVSPDGQLSIRCDVSLIASARNTGTATWGDGVIRFYFGRDRKVATDSVRLSVSEVQDNWGKQFDSRSVSHSDWYASAGAPFDAELEFRFADDVAPAKTRFTCGPALVATNDAPTVTSISVLPASGTVQAGDTLSVTWAASAAGTLWSTTLQVDGPFGFHEEYPELGAGSTTRTVRVVVPPTAFFDVPIVVSVTATDPGLQWGDRTLQTGLTVVDQTPPVVRNAWIQNRNASGLPFFVGDTIQLYVDASDNSKLAWFAWDLTGAVTVHDSVRAPVGMSSGTLPIPLVATPAWVGTSDITVHVRDGTGAASAMRPAGSVTVSPSYTYGTSAVATAPASTTATFGAAIPTATFGAAIPLASCGTGLDLTPSGDTLIVVEPEAKSLAVVNLARVSSRTSVIAHECHPAGPKVLSGPAFTTP